MPSKDPQRVAKQRGEAPIPSSGFRVTAAAAPGRVVQILDLRRKVGRQRHCRFEERSPVGATRRWRSTVEAEPDRGLDQLTDTIDEIGNPKLAIAQVDGHFASFASTQ